MSPFTRESRTRELKRISCYLNRRLSEIRAEARVQTVTPYRTLTFNLPECVKAKVKEVFVIFGALAFQSVDN